MNDVDSPTGTVVTLADGAVRATIATVGASLRGLVVDGVQAVPSYPIGVPAPSCSGVVLVPWPNRIRDGRWGDQQLAITEPAKGNATHGLLRYTDYRQVERDSSSLVLTADVHPQPGYPFWLRTRVAYALSSDGIEVTQEVANLNDRPAPFGVGAHPYLTLVDPAAPVTSADLTVTVPAAEYYLVDGRSIPVGREPVTPEFDLRGGRRLSELQLDTGYTALARDTTGSVRTTLAAPDGRTVTLWQGEGLDYVQVFTKPEYPGADGPVAAIAVEPQSCATDAFNSGDGLRLLAPGENAAFRWGVSFTR
ncbi:MAG: aldose 1-epimerase family protein [Gordonia sp. (in: high G+C Gram-positive bacteria)]|uniref:aldose 1-epimerase family protein n=1 Tax=Gordonia sp. (in: high G+C Gram-positive bacteria) TaxID=84139 RepID=UPI0039E4FD61